MTPESDSGWVTEISLKHWAGKELAGDPTVREKTRGGNFEVAIFDVITTRNASEGWTYVARDVFPRASLAHAWVMVIPGETLTARNCNHQKRNFEERRPNPLLYHPTSGAISPPFRVHNF